MATVLCFAFYTVRLGKEREAMASVCVLVCLCMFVCVCVCVCVSAFFLQMLPEMTPVVFSLKVYITYIRPPCNA